MDPGVEHRQSPFWFLRPTCTAHRRDRAEGANRSVVHTSRPRRSAPSDHKLRNGVELGALCWIAFADNVLRPAPRTDRHSLTVRVHVQRAFAELYAFREPQRSLPTTVIMHVHKRTYCGVFLHRSRRSIPISAVLRCRRISGVNTGCSSKWRPDSAFAYHEGRKHDDTKSPCYGSYRSPLPLEAGK